MKLTPAITLTALTLMMTSGTAGLVDVKLFAEETVVEKGQGKVDNAATDVNKATRKAKKKVRDATGNHSTKKDMKDKAKNVGDDLEDAAKKIERKVD